MGKPRIQADSIFTFFVITQLYAKIFLELEAVLDQKNSAKQLLRLAFTN